MKQKLLAVADDEMDYLHAKSAELEVCVNEFIRRLIQTEKQRNPVSLTPDQLKNRILAEMVQAQKKHKRSLVRRSKSRNINAL